MLRRRVGMEDHWRSIYFNNHRRIHISTPMRSEDFNQSNDMNFETPGLKVMEEVKSLDSKFKDLETQIGEIKTQQGSEIKIVKSEINHKFESFVLRLDHRFGMVQKKLSQQFDKLAADLHKQLGQFFTKGFFGVLGVAALLIGGAWVLPLKENERLEEEIKKRAIIIDGANKIL